MKTVGLVVGTLGFALVAAVGCGGTVVFEEDGGEGGQGGTGPTSSSSFTTTGPTTNGPSSSISTASGEGGTTSLATVGPGGPSSSTGFPGCGSLLDDIGGLGSPQCDSCMEAQCCPELLACDAGTECYGCVFGEPCTPAANAALEAFSNCYVAGCQEVCDGGQQCEPGEFQCFESGECFPGNFQCDGFVDCQDGTDEQFCEQNGICGSGVSSQDPELDQCLGDFCCDSFQQCSSFGENPDACNECLQQGGGPLCDEAIQCYFGSPCAEQPGEGICDSGVATGEGDIDACLGDFCCGEFNECSQFGQDIEGCYACLENQGGPQCDAALECAFGSPCLDGGGGGGGQFVEFCGTGLSVEGEELAACLDANCCPEFDSCVGGPQGAEGCAQCFEQGGGRLCNDAAACFQRCGGF